MRPAHSVAAVRRAPRPVLVALAALLALLAILGAPSRVFAHTALESSSPARGARLSTVPRELRLTFSEAVELAVSRIELLGPDSVAVRLSPVRFGDSAAVLVADIEGALGAGEYTVAWQVAGRDGHPVHGSFRFTIAPDAAGLASATAAAAARADSGALADSMPTARDGAPNAGAAPPAVGAFDAESPLYAAVRWLGFVAVLAMTGVVGFGLLVLPAARSARALPASFADAAGRLRRVGLLAGAALLVAAALRLMAQSVALHGAAGALDAAPLAELVTGTLWGTAWVVQVAAALLALAAFALLARRPAAGWPLAVVAVVAAALSLSLSGHAAALPHRVALAVVADVAHVLAAGGWLGTLLVLLVAGLPAALAGAPGERAEAAATLVNAFSPLALACAAVVALSGVVSAWLHLQTLDALVTSGYGRTLLVKLAFVALAAGAGAYNWRRRRPAMREERGAERLRRSATVELLLGVLVLAVTAVLVATPTPLDVLR